MRLSLGLNLFRRRKVEICVVIALIGIGIALYDSYSVAVCDGWYDLTVEIDRKISGDVSRVSYLGATNLEMADSFVEMVEELSESMEHGDPDKPFEVSVGFSFRASNLWGTWGHVQAYSHLVVVLHRSDGKQSVHRLEIPHRNVSRHVVISALNEVSSNE